MISHAKLGFICQQKRLGILFSSMTADEEVPPNCKNPKLNDDPFAYMCDGNAVSMVTHSTDKPTAADELPKYKLALRLPPTSRKNPLLFWRENTSEFSLMSATSTTDFL
jgi:hypothetical protein